MKAFHIKRHGFTMIEQIMALVVFAMSILLLTTAVQATKKIDQQLTLSHHLEWHLFIVQLNHHTLGYTLDQSDAQVVFRSPEKEPVYLMQSMDHKAGSVIYLRENNGYHPLLIGFQTAVIQKQNQTASITVAMSDHELYQLKFRPSQRARTLQVEKKKVTKQILVEKKSEEVEDEKTKLQPKSDPSP